jgi:hypothetical protein
MLPEPARGVALRRIRGFRTLQGVPRPPRALMGDRPGAPALPLPLGIGTCVLLGAAWNGPSPGPPSLGDCEAPHKD